MGKIRPIRGAGKRGKARGFSLIELTMAMSVLAIGLLGGIVVIGMATANNGRSKLHTTAVTLAESTMEKILAIPQRATGAAAQRSGLCRPRIQCPDRSGRLGIDLQRGIFGRHRFFPDAASELFHGLRNVLVRRGRDLRRALEN
jgi:prepilin-type N-terminal cleavage/methylation domain-containing protein